jgi:Fur family iron response transcriptional regulator
MKVTRIKARQSLRAAYTASMVETAPFPLPPTEIDRIARKLQGHGIQPTAQRIDIAAVFFAGDMHLSADQVIARVGRTGRPVSKATVYNTLGLLAERGLLAQVIVDSGKVFYDSNTKPHFHFYNVDDGELTDVEARHPLLESLPAPPPGTYAEGLDVIIRIRNRPSE